MEIRCCYPRFHYEIPEEIPTQTREVTTDDEVNHCLPQWRAMPLEEPLDPDGRGDGPWTRCQKTFEQFLCSK